jgi:hypothetical protein
MQVFKSKIISGLKKKKSRKLWGVQVKICANKALRKTYFLLAKWSLTKSISKLLTKLSLKKNQNKIFSKFSKTIYNNFT